MPYRACAILLTMAVLGLIRAEETPSDPSTQLSKVLKQLTDDDFQIREKATAALNEFPGEALPFVEAALQRTDLDAETRSRLQAALPFLRVKHQRLTLSAVKKSELAWNQKTLRDAFFDVGKHDPKWDKPAREALERCSLYFARNNRFQEPKEALAIEILLQQCITAGCDDALIFYLFLKMQEEQNTLSFAQKVQKYNEAATRIKDSRYPAARRAFVMLLGALCIAHTRKPYADGIVERLKMAMGEILPLIVEAARQPEMPRELLLGMLNDYVALAYFINEDRKIGFDELMTALPAELREGVVGLTLTGKVYTSIASDPHGKPEDKPTPEENSKYYFDRIHVAREALEKAYAAEPAFPPISEQMFAVVIGQGKARDELETWFKRARQANPDSYEICEAKLSYLDPYLNGSNEKMIAFGRELLKEGNFAARLPFILMDVHDMLSKRNDPEKREAYFRGEGVWDDVQAVFEGFLKQFPDATWQRSKYAYYAGLCGQWKVFAHQLKILGSDVNQRAFRNFQQFERFKLEAAKAGVGP